MVSWQCKMKSFLWEQQDRFLGVECRLEEIIRKEGPIDQLYWFTKRDRAIKFWKQHEEGKAALLYDTGCNTTYKWVVWTQEED